MANPFHDAEGKFCSQSGMQKSIQTLIKAGKLEEATKLASELTDILKTQEVRETLKTIPGPLLEKYRTEANKIVTSANVVGSNRERLTHQQEEKIFGGLSDAEVSGVHSILLDQEMKFKTDELAPAEAEFEAAKADLREKTGYADLYDLNSAQAMAELDAGFEGRRILSDLKKDAVENGLTPAFAGYIFKKIAAEQGVGDAYTSSTVGKTFTIAKADKPQQFDENLIPKIRNKKDAEILTTTLQTYLKENERKVDEYNVKATEAGRLKDLQSHFKADAAFAELRGINKLRSKARNLEQVRKSAESNIEWRKEVRAAGIVGNSLTPKSLSNLRGSELSHDSENKVNNAWIVNRNSNATSRSLSKIVGTSQNNEGHFALVAEDGKEYKSFTHYHSYSKSVTDYDVILDNGIKNPDMRRYGDTIGFSSSIDSGD